jgi:hypothetical protein
MATGGITVKVLGFKILEENATAVYDALEEAAGPAVQEGAEIPMGMMRRLVPKDTHKLERSIRFSFGKRGGEVRISKPPSGRGSRGPGKARVVGYILAGDDTTIVRSKQIQTHRKNKGKPAKFQNAFIQEFGTRTRKAHPFFLPAWRARKREFLAFITKRFREVLRTMKKQQTADAKAAAKLAKAA